MAYEPAVIGMIAAWVVGGVAVVLGASAEWEVSHELARATDRWTAPFVVRTYEPRAEAARRIAREGEILATHGYRAILQRGRLQGTAIQVPAGDDRQVLQTLDSEGRIAVTYARQ